MRNRPQQRKAVEPLLAEEVGGVAVVFLEQEDQQCAALHLLRAGRGGVHHGTLDDPIEADGGLGLDGLAPGHRRERALQNLFEIRAQHLDVHA